MIVTIITLTAIPTSLIITAIILKSFEISINTLTLGGLAIAIGELVDDAIVDVENVYWRLRENWASENPRPTLQIIYEASSEVRNSIVYATIIVVLVFLPLFYLQGIEGKIFAPLGIAYITSILASLDVSLSLTPALCSYFMSSEKALRPINLRFWKKKTAEEKLEIENKAFHPDDNDSPLLRFLKRKDTLLLNWGLNHTKIIITSAIILIVASMSIIPFFGTEFLPPFNEGSYTVNLSLPPGTSIEEANKVGSVAE